MHLYSTVNLELYNEFNLHNVVYFKMEGAAVKINGGQKIINIVNMNILH